MADQPFVGFSDMMTQSFEQTRKAMEKYADLFQKGIKASPWLDTDLNNKMKSYMDRNIAAANEFIRKLSQARDVQSFWQIQTDFMQTQWKAFGEQTKDLGETMRTARRWGALPRRPAWRNARTRMGNHASHTLWAGTVLRCNTTLTRTELQILILFIFPFADLWGVKMP